MMHEGRMAKFAKAFGNMKAKRDSPARTSHNGISDSNGPGTTLHRDSIDDDNTSNDSLPLTRAQAHDSQDLRDGRVNLVDDPTVSLNSSPVKSRPVNMAVGSTLQNPSSTATEDVSAPVKSTAPGTNATTRSQVLSPQPMLKRDGSTIGVTADAEGIRPNSWPKEMLRSPPHRRRVAQTLKFTDKAAKTSSNDTKVPLPTKDMTSLARSQNNQVKNLKTLSSTSPETLVSQPLQESVNATPSKSRVNDMRPQVPPKDLSRSPVPRISKSPEVTKSNSHRNAAPPGWEDGDSDIFSDSTLSTGYATIRASHAPELQSVDSVGRKSGKYSIADGSNGLVLPSGEVSQEFSHKLSQHKYHDIKPSPKIDQSQTPPPEDLMREFTSGEWMQQAIQCGSFQIPFLRASGSYSQISDDTARKVLGDRKEDEEISSILADDSPIIPAQHSMPPHDTSLTPLKSIVDPTNPENSPPYVGLAEWRSIQERRSKLTNNPAPAVKSQFDDDHASEIKDSNIVIGHSGLNYPPPLSLSNGQFPLGHQKFRKASGPLRRMRPGNIVKSSVNRVSCSPDAIGVISSSPANLWNPSATATGLSRSISKAQVNLDLNLSRKRSLDNYNETSVQSSDESYLDYEPQRILQMPYSALRDAPFDVDPSHQHNTPNLPSLESRLASMVNASPSQQSSLFASLSIYEWESAGDWLIQSMLNVMNDIRKARQDRRREEISFEQEVARRHDVVTKKINQIDKALLGMRKGGDAVLRERGHSQSTLGAHHHSRSHTLSEINI